MVTLVPMMASPVETGEQRRATSGGVSLFPGIGLCMILTGVPVYFLIVSDDYVTKPVCIRRFLGDSLPPVCPCFLPTSLPVCLPFLPQP